MHVRNPKITVYLVSHNYRTYVEEAINSVLKQSFKDWELLLIDDGSSDGTLDVFKNYEIDKRIKIYNMPGIGLPKICNFAANTAQGNYIIRLDGDDIFDENILLILSNCLDNNPDVGLVFPDYYLCAPDATPFEHIRRDKEVVSSRSLDYPPHGACTMVRKNAILEVGGYREDLGAQDGLDIWLKLKNKFKVHNINLPLFYYRQHGKNLTTKNEKIVFARRRIKKDASFDSLKQNTPILAVIPIRKNNDFLPSLWNVELNGKTLLKRRVEECLKSNLFSNIIVTCDDQRVKDILKEYDKDRVSFHHRTFASTFSDTTVLTTMKKIIEKYDPNSNGFSVINYIQSPFVSYSLLEESIQSMVLFNADSCLGVKKLKTTLYKRSKEGLIKITERNPFSSDSDNLFFDTRAFVALRHDSLTLKGNLRVAIETSEEESFFINNQIDLEVARKVTQKS